MNDINQTNKRLVVRVEAPSSACGFVGHMTADELKRVPPMPTCSSPARSAAWFTSAGRKSKTWKSRRGHSQQTVQGDPMPGGGRGLIGFVALGPIGRMFVLVKRDGASLRMLLECHSESVGPFCTPPAFSGG